MRNYDILKPILCIKLDISTSDVCLENMKLELTAAGKIPLNNFQ